MILLKSLGRSFLIYLSPLIFIISLPIYLSIYLYWLIRTSGAPICGAPQQMEFPWLVVRPNEWREHKFNGACAHSGFFSPLTKKFSSRKFKKTSKQLRKIKKNVFIVGFRMILKVDLLSFLIIYLNLSNSLISLNLAINIFLFASWPLS